jgi:ubiquinone biosynthesis accessory factor UbiK
MLDPATLDRISRRLASTLPEGVAIAGEELRDNARAALAASLARLDLVTREEFEVQRAVLARTRQKVEALEARVRALETASGLRTGVDGHRG